MPPELERQWRAAPGFFGAFGWRSESVDDLEADDLLGSLAEIEAAAGGEVLLFTGDRDMFQCVNDAVTVLFPRGGKDGPEVVDAPSVRERYGIEPEQVPDFIALRGDPSDGLPGAKGIGAKTARDLLRAHGTLEGVIAAASKPGAMTPRQAGALTGDPDALRAFKDIATLRRVDLERPPDAPLDRAGAAAAARELGMNRLAERLERVSPGTARSDARFGHHVPAVRLLCALAAVVALALVLPHAAPAADPSRPVMLAQGWNFAPDPGDDGLTDNWQGGERGNGWEPVTVPHVADATPRPEGLLGLRRLVPGPLHGPGDRRRSRLGAALRGGAAGRARLAERPRAHDDPHTIPTRRSSCPPSACARGRQHARRARRLPPQRAAARGLVELGRHHAPGLARRARPGRHARRRAAAAPRLRASQCEWNVLVDGWLENRSVRVQQPAVPRACSRPTATSRRAASRRAPCAPASACACASPCRSRAT